MASSTHNFTQKTRELFDLGGYANDWEDGHNDGNCIHHILGRTSISPYNACPLNNSRNHMPEGRKHLPSITCYEVKRKYLIKTKKYLDDMDYIPTEYDLAFLEKNKKYYD